MMALNTLAFLLCVTFVLATSNDTLPGLVPTGASSHFATRTPVLGVHELQSQIISLKHDLSRKLQANTLSCNSLADHPQPTPTSTSATGLRTQGLNSLCTKCSGSIPVTLSVVRSSRVASYRSSSTNLSASKVPDSYMPTLSDYTEEQIASGEAIRDASTLASRRQQERRVDGDCTFKNARVRTEFRKMSNVDRKAFTDAVACLQKSAPRYTQVASSSYPGLRSRHDEYVATHINMTYNIHGTADFLAWHRNYLFVWESDLAEICGYTGSLPYWDWSQDAQAVDQSDLFNGDEYSMGSNGKYVGERSNTYLGQQNVNFPPGTGGGCVYSGPFSESTGYQSHLGPIDSPYGDNVANHYDYNPRCLIRDLNSWFSSRYNTYSNVTDVILGQSTVQDFQNLIQGFVSGNSFGVHGGGHWLGGGPSQLMDFHSSPNDPLFFLHHAQIDRIWSIWQYLDADTRLSEIAGTSTLLNSPSTADMKLSDTIPFGLVTENFVLEDLMDTFTGRFCYRYE